MSAGLLLILYQTKVIHVQQACEHDMSVFPACLYSSQQQTFLCDFQQLQSDSQTSALCEWQVLNVPAEEKPAGSWTGNKCSQRQWCSPQETAALLSVTLGPQTLSFLFILRRVLDWWIKLTYIYAKAHARLKIDVSIRSHRKNITV